MLSSHLNIGQYLIEYAFNIIFKQQVLPLTFNLFVCTGYKKLFFVAIDGLYFPKYMLLDLMPSHTWH